MPHCLTSPSEKFFFFSIFLSQHLCHYFPEKCRKYTIQTKMDLKIDIERFVSNREWMVTVHSNSLKLIDFKFFLLFPSAEPCAMCILHSLKWMNQLSWTSFFFIPTEKNDKCLSIVKTKNVLPGREKKSRKFTWPGNIHQRKNHVSTYGSDARRLLLQ